MTETVREAERPGGAEPAGSTGTAGGGEGPGGDNAGAERAREPQFILYLDGDLYGEALQGLTLWVHHLLLPVYGREVTSSLPWCPRWWEHLEAVGQLYGLWMAWQQLTDANAEMVGPATWHRDFLGPVMLSLRDPSGPFAGCKPGAHRSKAAPHVDDPRG